MDTNLNSQIFTGHGYFRVYFKKFGQDKSLKYPKCIGVEENAEHVLCSYPRVRLPWETGSRPLQPIDVQSTTSDQWSECDRRMSKGMLGLRRLEI